MTKRWRNSNNLIKAIKSQNINDVKKYSKKTLKDTRYLEIASEYDSLEIIQYLVEQGYKYDLSTVLSYKHRHYFAKLASNIHYNLDNFIHQEELRRATPDNIDKLLEHTKINEVTLYHMINPELYLALHRKFGPSSISIREICYANINTDKKINIISSLLDLGHPLTVGKVVNDFRLVKFLYSKGWRVNKHMLKYATSYCTLDIIKFLYTDIHDFEFPRYDTLDMLKFLYKKGSKLTKKPTGGGSVFHSKVTYDVVKFLKDNGYEFNNYHYEHFIRYLSVDEFHKIAQNISKNSWFIRIALKYSSLEMVDYLYKQNVPLVKECYTSAKNITSLNYLYVRNCPMNYSAINELIEDKYCFVEFHEYIEKLSMIEWFYNHGVPITNKTEKLAYLTENQHLIDWIKEKKQRKLLYFLVLLSVFTILGLSSIYLIYCN